MPKFVWPWQWKRVYGRCPWVSAFSWEEYNEDHHRCILTAGHVGQCEIIALFRNQHRYYYGINYTDKTGTYVQFYVAPLPPGKTRDPLIGGPYHPEEPDA
jgi:hypothetical protein